MIEKILGFEGLFEDFEVVFEKFEPYLDFEKLSFEVMAEFEFEQCFVFEKFLDFEGELVE